MSSMIEIYQSDDSTIEVRLDGVQDTVWLSQNQLVDLFQRDQSVISRHLRNVFKDGELTRQGNVQKMQHAGAHKPATVYSLDVIISLGFRVKSPRGMMFRRWATARLKALLLEGYTLNQRLVEQESVDLRQALSLIRKTAQSSELTAKADGGLSEIVSRYARTFSWLQQYDEGLLDEPEGQTGGKLPGPVDAMASLNELKQSLVSRGEATELFAQLREDGLASLLGNLEQSVFGEPAYPSVESKAAHLLYFVIKNHPFSDGNKRSGAFLFVDFLHRNARLFNQRDEPVINDTGLAALTLLIAESDPQQKEVIIRLVMTMLAAN